MKKLFGSKPKELTFEEQAAKVVDVPVEVIKENFAEGSKDLKKDVEELKVHDIFTKKLIQNFIHKYLNLYLRFQISRDTSMR